MAQASAVLAQCRAKFPSLEFELKIIKTTGDKLQTASLANAEATLPKGLFTKELETALLKGKADIAVHSLKDLPTELPEGLKLGAVAGKREDARDVLLYKKPLKAGLKLGGFPPSLTVATSSTRRKAQLLALRPDFKVTDIRGNVGTRMRKLADQPDMDGTILAVAGMKRLGITISEDGRVQGKDIPDKISAMILDFDEMLPCVGQAALGLEVREGDDRIAALCRELNDEATFQCVTAERAFLRAMGGGCQSPVAAYAYIDGTEIELRAVSFLGPTARRAQKAALL